MCRYTSGYNLELWFGARDGHATAGATVRVMHPLCFVNSKVMFRFIRHTPVGDCSLLYSC